MSGLVVGIDLGTTHSVAAAVRDGVPVVLEGTDGRSLVPSVVAVDDEGHVVVGHAARDIAVRRPDRAIARFKTDMGTDATYALDGVQYTPVTLSALVLKEMKALAEASLGHEVAEVVVTVPAWFREPQRTATMDAARLAGLEVKRLVNEPTAAAMAHGLHEGDVERRSIVLDLGGGTFDVTVLEMFAGMVEVASSSGDTHLGGEDFTDRIVAWALSEAGVGLEGVDAGRLGVLRHRCEVAKRTLATLHEAEVRLDGIVAAGGMLTLTREAVVEMSASLLQRVRQCVQEALLQAGALPYAMEEVLLVGGATRMQAVRQVARDVFGKEPLESVDPDHIVALGAAVQGGLVAKDAAVSDLVVTDVLTHSLGVAVTREWEGTRFRDRFDPVLHRGTTLPCSRVSHYSTLHHQQSQVVVRVFEGEHRDVNHNEHLGELIVDALPTDPDPDYRVGFTVRFTHDANGLLEVEAHVDDRDTPVRVVLQRAGPTLEGADFEAAVRALASLKTHPRDLLPNRLALERARRVYTLLSGHDRETVDQLILAMEASMEQGDVEGVAQRRAAMVAYVDRMVSVHDLDGPGLDR